MSSAVPRPGIALGTYPERRDEAPGWWQRKAERMARRIPGQRVDRKELEAFADRVAGFRTQFSADSDAALEARIAELRNGLFKEGPDGPLAALGFALIAEQAERILGMSPYRVQVMAGYAMLRGLLAEMQTGEGKTLTAVLPTCCAALAGIPVHVITVNDYLVERDAELMRPLYESLGLSVGVVRDADSDLEGRRAAYAADITYVTNKQVAFDYLRDRVARTGGRSRFEAEWLARSGDDSPLVMRGLCFALIDEADSVLIDEAGTPLILSQNADAGDLVRISEQALEIADVLETPRHFSVDRSARRVHLTEAGRTEIESACAALEGIWAARRRREELIEQALQARFLYLRDEHYLVRDDQVMIIDRNTGRVMPDRSWEMGLHQMIETKEGVEVSGQRQTLARISYQKFYGRYLRLCGMTGTAEEVRDELFDFYGLETVTIPTRRPVQRYLEDDRVFSTLAEKLDDIVRRTRILREIGRPALIGVNTVAESLAVSRALTEAGLSHEVLNAGNDHEEAEIIARAGEPGRLTIATAMAGRGTDIQLSPEVLEAGGLHVISTLRGDAGRIDRQLFGRCGRQGDPGSYVQLDSLEDASLERDLPRFARRALSTLLHTTPRLGQRLARALVGRVQRNHERQAERARRAMVAQEENLERTLAFTGELE